MSRLLPLPDRISIVDIPVRCVLGIKPSERRRRTLVRINVTLHVRLDKACHSDSLGDTLDYARLHRRIVRMVRGSHFYLVEKLAAAVAELCLQDRFVKRADVEVEKRGALGKAGRIKIAISREKN